MGCYKTSPRFGAVFFAPVPRDARQRSPPSDRGCSGQSRCRVRAPSPTRLSGDGLAETAPLSTDFVDKFSSTERNPHGQESERWFAQKMSTRRDAAFMITVIIMTAIFCV